MAYDDPTPVGAFGRVDSAPDQEEQVDMSDSASLADSAPLADWKPRFRAWIEGA